MNITHVNPNAAWPPGRVLRNGSRRRCSIAAVALLAPAFLFNPVQAGGPQHYNVGADKLAIGGYDPVSYLDKNLAAKGRPELTATNETIVYRFATDENRRRFVAAPEKYRPAYGGWCATAMAKGEKVEIDPTNFKVTHGRLFLFFRAFYGNALKDWNKDEANLTLKADANWKRLAGE